MDALNDRQKELAASFYDHAIGMTRRWSRRWPGMKDDFESAAGLACVEAARRYRDGVGASFETFAYSRVWSRLCVELRSDCRLRRRWKGQPSDHGAEPCSVDSLTEIEVEETFASLLRRTCGRDREILRRIYRDDETQIEVARSLGVSPESLCRRQRRALNRIKCFVEGETVLPVSS